MADPRGFEEEILMHIIHGGSPIDDGDAPQEQHEEEDDGSQYLSLEQGEQGVGDDNAGEVVK
jgi:hypothetical protein